MNYSKSAFLLVTFALGSLSCVRAVNETYDIDPVHTWVGFTVAHFFTPVPGYFGRINGVIGLDRDHLESSNVEVIIEVASITTNTKIRDDDLRSAKFFAADKYPTMTFKSRSWKHSSGNVYEVTGDLTIKSVTKQVVLKVTSLGFGRGMKGASISGWDVFATLNRHDFGLDADRGVIGDIVDVVIHVEADLREKSQS